MCTYVSNGVKMAVIVVAMIMKYNFALISPSADKSVDEVVNELMLCQVRSRVCELSQVYVRV